MCSNKNADPCISMTGINKTFGFTKVLRDVSITVPRSSVFGLLGPSGCGKTTTVKIIAGIADGDEGGGDTTILGERMPSLELMAKIGYMAQADALYDSLSGQENLEFFGTLHGLKGKHLRNRIMEVLQLVDLHEDLRKPVSRYSGGMRRRLSLAISILHQPEVLILDEPTVGIDPLLRKRIWDEFYRLAESGITILVTTHVMDEAEKCSELAMMRAGRIIATGSPSSLLQETGLDNLESIFLMYGEKQAGDDDEN